MKTSNHGKPVDNSIPKVNRSTWRLLATFALMIAFSPAASGQPEGKILFNDTAIT